jgi:hypothetical protein
MQEFIFYKWLTGGCLLDWSDMLVVALGIVFVMTGK